MNWKMLGKAILFPPVWLTFLLTILSAAALTAVFLTGWDHTAVGYAVYVLSFYSLSVLCAFCAVVLPKQYRKIRDKLYTNPVSRRFLTDRFFRTTVSLYLALAINLMYVGLNLWLRQQMKTNWFAILAAYYTILAVMRFLLLRYVRGNTIGESLLREWKRARLCACILLLINLSLSGAVLMILRWNRGFDYPGVMIYVAALYTFYSTIHAVVNTIKYRHFGSPVMSAAKTVSLSAALVSMLNLETAMFAQFGEDMTRQNQQLFIILTGAGVSIIVVTLSLRLIIRATNEIRRINHGE